MRHRSILHTVWKNEKRRTKTQKKNFSVKKKFNVKWRFLVFLTWKTQENYFSESLPAFFSFFHTVLHSTRQHSLRHPSCQHRTQRANQRAILDHRKSNNSKRSTWHYQRCIRTNSAETRNEQLHNFRYWQLELLVGLVLPELLRWRGKLRRWPTGFVDFEQTTNWG